MLIEQTLDKLTAMKLGAMADPPPEGRLTMMSCTPLDVPACMVQIGTIQCYLKQQWCCDSTGPRRMTMRTTRIRGNPHEHQTVFEET